MIDDLRFLKWEVPEGVPFEILLLAWDLQDGAASPPKKMKMDGTGGRRENREIAKQLTAILASRLLVFARGKFDFRMLKIHYSSLGDNMVIRRALFGLVLFAVVLAVPSRHSARTGHEACSRNGGRRV